jgi:CDP-glycerol glycerophosphotransferase (TagB/SpsB family)
MVSNQAKAYDRVFVAGEAAVRRHRAALVDFDERHLVRVGRPQLDLNPEPIIPESQRRTILYAPTWEGEDESNNFTSLDCYGPEIVAAVLAQPNIRLVYKPHPRVINSTNLKVRAAHARIVEVLQAADLAEPDAGHLFMPGADILAVFPRVDLLIADVSSVTLDFLYSRAEAPIVLTDRRSNRAGLLLEAPIADGSHVVDATTIDTLPAALAELLAADSFHDKRAQLRDFYFDGVAKGDSTLKFYDALERIIADHATGVELTRALAARGTWHPDEHL